jgi:pimeloyl-ACP methyl ester carboxylesterase
MAQAVLNTTQQHAQPDALAPIKAFRASHPYRSIDFDGLRWDYISAGSGKQGFLVLGGGLSTGESSFERITKMEGRFQVISPSYPAAQTMRRLLAGLAAVLDTEGIEKAHVLGHSLGAGIAHCFVRAYPQRVDKLILSSFGLYTPFRQAAAKFMIGLFRLLPYGFMNSYYKKAFKRLLKDAPDETRAFMTAFTGDLLDHQHNKQSLMGQFDIMGDMFNNAEDNRIREVVNIGSRALILQAKDDRGFKPAEQAALRATYPGATVHLFESGGHLAGVTRSDEYEAAIEAHLKA